MLEKTGFTMSPTVKEKCGEELSILHNWCPKHSQYSSLSNYRLLSDCNENFRSRGDKRKRSLDSSVRAGDKFASLEYAPLIFTRAATITIKLLSDTEVKRNAKKRSLHSSIWGGDKSQTREVHSYGCC